MITETTIQKEATERHKFCDVCGIEIKIGLACSVAYCMYCRKDLCESCVGHEESTPGDYREVYCKNCWEIGNEYRPIIEKHSMKISSLYKEWEDKCKGKVKAGIPLTRRSWICMGKCPQCRDPNREPSLIRKRNKEEFKHELRLELQ